MRQECRPRAPLWPQTYIYGVCPSSSGSGVSAKSSVPPFGLRFQITEYASHNDTEEYVLSVTTEGKGDDAEQAKKAVSDMRERVVTVLEAFREEISNAFS